jgi:hypothetical protein
VVKNIPKNTAAASVRYSLAVCLKSLPSRCACPKPVSTYRVEVKNNDPTTTVTGQKYKSMDTSDTAMADIKDSENKSDLGNLSKVIDQYD